MPRCCSARASIRASNARIRSKMNRGRAGPPSSLASNLAITRSTRTAVGSARASVDRDIEMASTASAEKRVARPSKSSRDCKRLLGRGLCMVCAVDETRPSGVGCAEKRVARPSKPSRDCKRLLGRGLCMVCAVDETRPSGHLATSAILLGRATQSQRTVFSAHAVSAVANGRSIFRTPPTGLLTRSCRSTRRARRRSNYLRRMNPWKMCRPAGRHAALGTSRGDVRTNEPCDAP